MDPGKVYAFVKKYALILAGNFCVALGILYFLTPAGMITGGVTGVAIAIRNVTGIPISVGTGILNIILLALGTLILGRQFAADTLFTALSYPVILRILEMAFSVTGPLTDNLAICMCASALLFGFGISLILNQGASSGGFDVIAVILHRKLGTPIGPAVFLMEIICMMSQISFTSTDGVLAGILVVIAYTHLLNRFLSNGATRVQVQVVSRHYEEITNLILKNFNRGVTLYPVKGGYSGQESYSVLTVIHPKELFRIREAILKKDPEAFVTIIQAAEVNGKGFTIEKNINEVSEAKTFR